MKPHLLALVLLASLGACSKPPTTIVAPAERVSVVRKMQLDDKATSRIEFESAHARGVIEILPDVGIGYASTSTTTAGASSDSRTTTLLTVDGKTLLFDGEQLTIGERSYGPLSGDVKVRIERAGVFIDGEKRGEL